MHNKFAILLGIILLPLVIQAQTRQVTNVDTSLGLKEKYSVLKTNAQIKQGNYLAYNASGKLLLCEGYYTNNLKDSVWNYYSFNKELVETGHYKNGMRTGVWNAWNYKKELCITYDYTNNKLSFYKPRKLDSAKAVNVITGNDTLKRVLDKPPIYLDGDGVFITYVGSNLKYPVRARESGVTGKVIIGIIIDKNGQPTNYRVIQSLGYGCDEAALNAIKKVKGYWLPGILNGNAVTSEFETGLTFSLQDH